MQGLGVFPTQYVDSNKCCLGDLPDFQVKSGYDQTHVTKYPLVVEQFAIEHGHRHSEFSHE